MKLKELRSALAIAAMLAVVSTGGAAAGEPERNPNFVNTGGGLEGGPAVRTAKEQALYEQKRKLADEYAAVRAGTLLRATYEADLDMFLAEVGASSSARMTEATASEDSLPVAVKSQKKAFYCGPATAAEILAYLDVTTGPRGESLTQGHLAARCEAGYLCTDALGQTPWYYHSGYPHPMKTTLNEWWAIDYYLVANDTDTWIDDMIWSISGMGNPIASNVNEWKGRGYHLVNHPTNLDIGHWVAVQGYKSSGSSTRYVDSIWGTDFWPWSGDVEAHNYIPTSQFKWLMNNHSKGYIW